MACIHHQDYNTNHTYLQLAEYAYRGALLLKRKRMEIDLPDATTNNNPDDYYLKPALLKTPKIEQIEAPNQICSYINFSSTKIDPNSQKCFEKMGTIESVEALVEKKRERNAIYNAIIECKLAKGKAVGPHVQKMIGFFQSLEKLGFPISQELGVGIILGTLPLEYGCFIKDFYRCEFEKTWNELHEMLKSFEIHIGKKDNPTNAKKKGKANKGKGNVQIMNLTKSHPALQSQCGAKTHDLCNYCNAFGHWKRNCQKYLEDRKKGVLDIL